jgi:hypothetical protein
MGWFNLLTKVKMGNFSSYVKLPSSSNSNSKGKLCIVKQDKVYRHDDYVIITKYYLPDRNIGFHILDDLLYVYSTLEADYNVTYSVGGKKEITLPDKIYDKIINIHKLTELKKIKSVFIIDELKKLNNYNTFIVSV